MFPLIENYFSELNFIRRIVQLDFFANFFYIECLSEACFCNFSMYETAGCKIAPLRMFMQNRLEDPVSLW